MKAKNTKRFLSLSKIHKSGQRLIEATFPARPVHGLHLLEIQKRPLRLFFDAALDKLHSSGSCQRVGRIMRLVLLLDGQWVGGVVLGSTFPNILVRDRELDLRQFITDYKDRGLSSPWCRENKPYWEALQTIVNHARAFIFPEFHGHGLATKAQGLLLSEGIALWEKKYNSRVYALDNICDHPSSKLFAENGWKLVGQTRGYTADHDNKFASDEDGLRINSALTPSGKRWWVWTRIIDPSVLAQICERFYTLSLTI